MAKTADQNGTAVAKPEWFADGLQFKCTQCGNCCTGPPGFVWFNDEEAAAIADYLGMDDAAFRRTFAMTINGKWSLKELKRNGKYDCIFLDRDEKGKALCRIYPVRPQQCRTWPFWPELLKNKSAWQRAAKTCPGMNEGTFFPVEQVRIIRDSNDD